MMFYTLETFKFPYEMITCLKVPYLNVIITCSSILIMKVIFELVAFKSRFNLTITMVLNSVKQKS